VPVSPHKIFYQNRKVLVMAGRGKKGRFTAGEAKQLPQEEPLDIAE